MIAATRQRAFTLVEVLVVISILSLLAAILFPVFSRAREDARRTVCLSNLRQIGVATAMYLADNDGVYPHAVNFTDKLHPDNFSPPLPASIPVITDVLQPYLHSSDVFRCPSDDGVFPADGPPTLPSAFAAWRSSYTFTLLLDDQTADCWGDPAGLTYAGDTDGDWHSWRGADFFHDRWNHLYFDGHVGSTLGSDGGPYDPVASHAALGCNAL